MKSRKEALLGQIALEKGLVTKRQLGACLRSPGRSLGSVLAGRGLVRREDLEGLRRERDRRLRALGEYRRMKKIELLFGQLLVRLDLATMNQVNKCLEIQRGLAEKGLRPLPRLGDLLVEQGFVDRPTLDEILAMRKR